MDYKSHEEDGGVFDWLWLKEIVLCKGILVL
jgi:hypothetical protein